MDVGNALKTLRAQKAINQKSIAKYLNIERSTYARIEENQTQLTILLGVKIAAYYGMEFNYFALCLEYERYLNCPTTERLVKASVN